MNTCNRLSVFIIFLFYFSHPSYSQVLPDTTSYKSSEERIQWWRDARFGLFIHFGLYSELEGQWNGKEVEGGGEWIQNHAKIPNKDYEILMKEFNPTKFDADELAKIAKNAGAKYVVMGAKHHEGFAMYDSKFSDFKITNTPYAHDPLKDMADACLKHGLKFGIYYSHVIDWHELGGEGNTWDFSPNTSEQFNFYFYNKVIPQVKELLTNYGKISVMWFDVWFKSLLTLEQANDLRKLVMSLQPECIINSRIGFNDLADYDQADDNQMTAGNIFKDWETPVTMNDTWGFKKDDHDWKPLSMLIQQMVRINSRGGNYLLNVGPTASGAIPKPSIDRLSQIGQWLHVNEESLRGTSASPFSSEVEWGYVTTRPGKLYFHIFNWPDSSLTVYGIKSKIAKVYLLADKNKTPVPYHQYADSTIDLYQTKFILPHECPDSIDAVLVAEIEQPARFNSHIMEQASGKITLKAYQAQIVRSDKNSSLSTDSRGLTCEWIHPADSLKWNFEVYHPGIYQVIAVTAPFWNEPWQSGHQIAVTLGSQKIENILQDDGKMPDPADRASDFVVSNFGTVKIDNAGLQSLSLKPFKIMGEKGIRLFEILLIPEKNSHLNIQ